MKRRALIGLIVLTALACVLDPVLAHLAARHNVAGALLSPAGVEDPSAWAIALGYLAARFGSLALLCITAGVLAASLVGKALDRFAPAPTK